MPPRCFRARGAGDAPRDFVGWMVRYVPQPRHFGKRERVPLRTPLPSLSQPRMKRAYGCIIDTAKAEWWSWEQCHFPRPGWTSWGGRRVNTECRVEETATARRLVDAEIYIRTHSLLPGRWAAGSTGHAFTGEGFHASCFLIGTSSSRALAVFRATAHLGSLSRHQSVWTQPFAWVSRSAGPWSALACRRGPSRPLRPPFAVSPSDCFLSDGAVEGSSAKRKSFIISPGPSVVRS